MTRRRIFAAVTLLFLVFAEGLDGGQPLMLQASPAIGPAPGFVRVRARIEPSADNRVLEIAAVSADFTRTSAIQLNGSRAPRVSVFDYGNLPAGDYEVTAVLHGSAGTRAAARVGIHVVPTAGHP